MGTLKNYKGVEVEGIASATWRKLEKIVENFNDKGFDKVLKNWKQRRFKFHHKS